MRLSLLDRSRTRAGEPDSAALHHTVERAVRAERLGYHRFWVAEHHAVPGIASGSPPVLIAAVAGRTSTIRVGSGGVMLPNHRPLVVAEQFAMLDALFPGRIDLGVGRSLGFTSPVRRALGEPGDFDLGELRAYLAGEAAVTARPALDRELPLFVLATGRGISVAAEAGLPVVVGGPALDSPEIGARLDAYRATAADPYVIVSTDVLVADTDAEARDLALPEAWAMAASRTTGSFPPLEKADPDRPLTSSQQARVAAHLARSIHGSPDTVAGRLDDLRERTGADELLAFSSTFDLAAQARSDEALAGLFGE